MAEYTDYLRRRSDTPTSLTDIIGAVRSRWRIKLLLRGAVRIVAVTVAFLLIAAFALESARFSIPSIIAARVLLFVALGASAYWFLIRPLRRRVTDEQVALYLEEHDPTLEAALLSAVEASKNGRDASPALIQKLVDQAVEACTEKDAARRAEEAPLKRWGLGFAALAVATLLAVTIGPAFLRNALSAILLIQRSVEAAAPYRIEVTPGSTKIPKGADQEITARLAGFDAAEAVLMVRTGDAAQFETLPLVRNEDGTYEGLLFDVAERTEYRVVADGVQSPLYTLEVVETPYVERLETEYHFPVYTGLEPQLIEDGGDIAVLRGTEVRLRVHPTMRTQGGRVALNDNESVELTPQEDGTLTASFVAREDGFYRIELDAPTGERMAGSPQYTIDVLSDGAPSVRFSKPGRDTSASAIEEVFLEAQAEDDFGVRNLELVYSVNGGPEKVVPLFAGRNRLPEVTAGYTLYLEELGVSPGDAVSYFARVQDNSNPAQRATSDLYFLRIRPFDRNFREAQSAGGGGGGGGGGGQVEALSEQQRQIISATFNVQRDRPSMTAERFRESATVVSLSQSRLREQVEGLLTRLNSQLVQQDPAFAEITRMLPEAVQAMKDAESQLAAGNTQQALPFEYKSLQILQRAEEAYEQQVSVQRQAGGGGGGGSAQAQELAEIFEQELSRMANRYETGQQQAQQNADRQVDELLERLRELARRQEQEAARQRLRALEGGGSASSAAAQRALAEQAEEAARRLERLAREENRPDLQEAARQLQQAADQMRRAAAAGGQGAGQAQAALERLQETQRRLEQQQAGRAARDIQNAQREADELARLQQQIAEDVRDLANSPPNANRRQLAQQINEQKTELESRLNQLEQQLDRAARDAASTERNASRQLAEAASAIRDNRLGDRIRYSQNLVNRGASPQIYNQAENEIASGIEEVREQLREAQQALGQGGGENPNRMETALERARRLARAAESQQQRLRERAESGSQGQGQDRGQGQQGGDQGDAPGQSNQNARQEGDQQGGQPGQNGQGQQAGQRGQQGQGQQGQGGQGGNDNQAGDGNGQFADGRNFGGGAFGGNQLNPGGGWGLGWEFPRNFRLSEDDIRQLRAEARNWTQEAQQLMRDLSAEGLDTREVQEILRQMRQLEDPRVYQNVAELARLQRQVAENLKRFEFELRRQTEGTENAMVLSGADETPESFRRLVEEYFKSLSRSSTTR